MDLGDVTRKEEEFLRAELERYRSPTRRVISTIKTVTSVGVALYALNAGVQLVRLVESDAFVARQRMVESGARLADRLQGDRAFLTLNTAYFKAKGFVDDDFARDLAHFKHYQRRAKRTEREFDAAVERVYNPFAMLE